MEVADLQALQFASGSCDLVVCGEVLAHLDDDARAAGELARVLRPGGVLVASVRVTPFGFPLVGLFERQVYRRLLKRRLQSGEGSLVPPTGKMRLVSSLLRAFFELDTLFLGPSPGLLRPAGLGSSPLLIEQYHRQDEGQLGEDHDQPHPGRERDRDASGDVARQG